MKLSHALIIAALFALSACSGSHRPVYSGHEESTKNVPGFSKEGKKMTPYAKLGQSYSVDGETYVPRHQPDYVEEGMASWYGPGFHGGKTANGEEFDKNEMTAAHRTLPMPSIVKVTMLSTGKEAIVRINDRGPFSKGRIIDLSYAAAKEIGLIAKGTAKVRVEYMREESEKFAALLTQGRDPKSIDLAEEILSKPETQYAQADASPAMEPTKDAAAESSVDAIASVDLPAPAPSGKITTPAASSPFAAMDEPTSAATNMNVAAAETVKESTPIAGHFLQLGAFLQQSNADRLRLKVAKLGQVKILSKAEGTNPLMYVVRMGPYASADESSKVMDELAALGINPKIISQ